MIEIDTPVVVIRHSESGIYDETRERAREQGAAAPMKRGVRPYDGGSASQQRSSAARPLSLLSSCGGSDGEANTDPTTKA